MMKPKALTEHEEGMLEYLEDIIGSSRYKQPIEECAKSVEELNEARGEKVKALISSVNWWKIGMKFRLLFHPETCNPAPKTNPSADPNVCSDLF
jgi:hypothetical protein